MVIVHVKVRQKRIRFVFLFKISFSRKMSFNDPLGARNCLVRFILFIINSKFRALFFLVLIINRLDEQSYNAATRSIFCYVNKKIFEK